MKTLLLVILCSAVIVAFFGVAMWLAKVAHGHDRSSDISTSPHMKERGIECAAHQAIKQNSQNDDCSHESLCDCNCSSCTTQNQERHNDKGQE